MTELTYGRLDQVLRSLGFSAHQLEGEARGYRHGVGARLTFPNMPDEKPVLPHHLEAVRAILTAFGLPEPPELTPPAQRAG